tara:strand:+ start:40 stop:279 length:240 start_codon:yes stop_codon:yes gene_type:complete
MNEVMDYLFGPIGKEYCMYFYFLSVFAYILFIMALVSVMMMAMKGKVKNMLNAFIVVFQPFLLYFVNRMFYSMCVNSLA